MFDAARLPEWNYPPRYNIAPTDSIPIIRIDSRDGVREMVLARWGLIPFWMKEKPEGAAHQRPRRDGRLAADVPRRVPAPAGADPGNRLLRVAGARRRQAALSLRPQGPKPFAFAGLWEFNRRLDEDSPRRRSSSASPTRSSPASMTACR